MRWRSGRRQRGDKPQLVVHTNFTVGYGYSKTGKSLNEAVAERQAVAEQQIDEFLKDMDTSGFEVERLATSAEVLETAVMEVAVARKMDLLVVGSRGLGGTFMLGSVAERIVLHSMLPVLVVKKKGETLKIIDALFGSG
jgi:nucleotide-binding universal stress UspA family protein